MGNMIRRLGNMLRLTPGESRMYKEERPNPAKFASLTEDLMNGKGSKLLMMVVSGLLVLAIGASYNASSRLASIETKVDAMVSNQMELRARILYLERGRVLDHQKYDKEHGQ